MYVLLKNNICIGTQNLKLNDESLAEDERQIELKNFKGDPFSVLGKEYVNGKFVETEKSDSEKQYEKNITNIQFLQDTDWQVIRHRDQLALGIETSLSEMKYQELLEKRQQARDSIVDIDQV